MNRSVLLSNARQVHDLAAHHPTISLNDQTITFHFFPFTFDAPERNPISYQHIYNGDRPLVLEKISLSAQQFLSSATIRYPLEDPSRQTPISIYRQHPDHIEHPLAPFDDPDDRYFFASLSITPYHIKFGFIDTSLPEIDYHDIHLRTPEHAAACSPSFIPLDLPDIEIILPSFLGLDLTLIATQFTEDLDSERAAIAEYFKKNPEERVYADKTLAESYSLPYHLSIHPNRLFPEEMFDCTISHETAILPPNKRCPDHHCLAPDETSAKVLEFFITRSQPSPPRSPI